jgi:hypothetical protein
MHVSAVKKGRARLMRVRPFFLALGADWVMSLTELR